ncbi:hypothetical protein ACKWTF_014709 [Chironomus riparius]
MSDEIYEQGSSSSKQVEVIEPPKSPPSLLSDANLIKIDKKLIFKLSKDGKNVKNEVKSICKVLHFSSEWSFEEVMTSIDGLDPKEYPQLFIFLIEATNLGFSSNNQDDSSAKVAQIHQMLLKFSLTRPMILQLTSEDENMSKFYYKEENSNQFDVVDDLQHKIEDINSFPTFMSCFLDGNLVRTENKLLGMLDQLQNSSIFLRFLKTLKLSDKFFQKLVLKCSKNSSLAEFMAVLDVPFENDQMTLNYKAQSYLSQVFKGSQPLDVSTSVLLTAVENQNVEVIDYLIWNLTHFIQQLPFDHQVKVSTSAFDRGQLHDFCNLIDVADFPFPDKFKKEPTEHDRFEAIVEERAELEAAIKEENFDGIAKYTKINQNLKVVYNINNKSALSLAAEFEKLSAFNYLKLSGFKTTNPNEKLEECEKKTRKFVAQQRKQNVSTALIDDERSVNLLCNKSVICNKRISKEDEIKYRKKIRRWFEDISKIRNGSEFLDVAASCAKLTIIFDFENKTVENVSLSGPNVEGSMYPLSKWIFVGAKLIDDSGAKRKQKIKGVLAHELCHYVMRLVYENQEMPYYKDSNDMKNKFKAIVKTINKWTTEDLERPDDKCNGIISSVFTAYKVEDFHPELIVRVVQILSNFDDSDEKLKYLELKYKVLFDFWFNQVVPDLQKYLQRNEEVIRLNRTIELLPAIQKLKIKLLNQDEIKKITENKVVVVKTNVPKLLLFNIHKDLQKKDRSLFNSQNIFIDPEKLKNLQLWDDYNSICSDNQELSIFVDCTRGIPDSLGSIFINKELNFIFIVSNEIQCEKVNYIFKEQEIKDAVKLKVNYNWKDLTEGSQNLMLKTKINFQNNSQITLLDLVMNRIETEEPASSTAVENDKEDIDDLVNEQLLNLVLENHQVLINSNENDDKNFDLLYEKRDFVKKVIITAENEEDEDSEDEKSEGLFTKIRNVYLKIKQKKINVNGRKIKDEDISQEKLLEESKNQQYVLISDYAGNGKSWAMKNLSKTLIKENPTSWVSYVDLKQFIDQFKAQQDEPDFSSFMVEHILMPQQQFEAKIFQKLYKDGRIFILFDGFDEIAPNYAEFVSKLAQNFQQNGGNQLWIATRDYFEVDLMEKLKLNVAYSLDEMTEYAGIDLIAKSWLLMDLQKDNNEPKSKKEFDKFIKSSPKYKNYRNKARKIIKKAEISRNNSVGLPQLFKMIAVGFKNEENVDDLQGIKIYAKFLDILYKRWSQGKGQIRDEANVKSQRFKLSFYNFHQFQAVLSLFPELAKILFPNYDGSEWPQEEVIACALMSIKNGKIYFPHETFREYFVADAIVNALQNKETEKKVLKFVEKIFYTEKFKIIKIFILNAINEKSLLEKVKPQMEKLIYCADSFGLIFTENLENLADFSIKVLKNGKYKSIKDVLDRNTEIIVRNIKSAKLFSKFQDFIFVFLKIDDLKALILISCVLQGFVESSLEIEIFEEFVTKTEEKSDREFIRQGLMVKSSDRHKGNIFYFLSKSTNLNAHKVQKLLKIMEKFLTATEIIELISKCEEDGQNILQVCVEEKSEKKLKILLTEIEKYFAVQNLPQNFKKLVKQQDGLQKNILYYAANCDKLEVHETLWELLLKIFEYRDELKDFVLQKDRSGNNFVYVLVETNKNLAIIEWTFKNLKENFSDAQFQEILTSKGWMEMNLLQNAALWSKVIVIHQFLWKFFRDFCGTDAKYLEMLKEVDELGQNILQNAAWNLSNEFFEFMIQELEKIASQDEIRQMLGNLDKLNQNLLQSAASSNESSELHKTLWKTLRKYFEKSEILQFIKNVDVEGNNLLFTAVNGYKPIKEIVELTWNEIKSFLTHDEQAEYLTMKGKDDKNLKQICSKYDKELSAWIESQIKYYKLVF